MSASPSHDDAAQEPSSATPFEDWLKEIWTKYRDWILGLCAIVLLAIAARGAWTLVAAQRERSVQAAYARATTPAELRAFADLNPGHPLAGVALLTLADRAYAEGRMGEAAAGYERAEGALKSAVLMGRCRLGLAIAQIQAGQAPEGELGLRRLMDDATQSHAVRSEAAYHLATLAAATGRADELRQIQTRILQIDPASPWAERAFALRAEPAAPAGPAAGKSSGGPAITFPAK